MTFSNKVFFKDIGVSQCKEQTKKQSIKSKKPLKVKAQSDSSDSQRRKLREQVTIFHRSYAMRFYAYHAFEQ
jgi:hypothetical protein